MWTELKTLEWDILNTDRLILSIQCTKYVYTLDFLLDPLFWIPLLYQSYV